MLNVVEGKSWVRNIIDCEMQTILDFVAIFFLVTSDIFSLSLGEGIFRNMAYCSYFTTFFIIGLAMFFYSIQCQKLCKQVGISCIGPWSKVIDDFLNFTFIFVNLLRKTIRI